MSKELSRIQAKVSIVIKIDEVGETADMCTVEEVQEGLAELLETVGVPGDIKVLEYKVTEVLDNE